MLYVICYMKVIIGLGNPGEEYSGTRHNIGFEIVDKIQREWDLPDFEFNKKFNAEISKGVCEPLTVNCELLLAKPQTFMNLSGETVRSILDFYKLTPGDIIVVHDDLDIPTGKYKLATDSSSAGHNGVQNIIDQLSTQKFNRVRVGIGESTEEGAIKCQLGAHDYVLDKFSPQEKEAIEKLSANILKEIEQLIAK
jgi:peptidyl-tRNA hydrolase, PTH1 family